MILVLACFLGGWVAQRFLARPAAAGAVLDGVVIYVALPALVLDKLPELSLGLSVAIPVLVAWAGVAVAATVVYAASRLRSWDASTTGALLLVTPLGNSAFLGLPMVGALLGADHLGPALTFDQLGSFLALTTYGAWIASRYGADSRGWRPALGRLLLFPPFVALLASIPLRAVELPKAVETALDPLGWLVAPLALLALGLRFRLVLPRRLLEPAAWCLATKMLLLPLLGLAAAVLAGGRGEPAWDAAVVQVGMPPMVMAAIVATSARLDGQLSTLVVGFGILASFVTLPVLALLLP